MSPLAKELTELRSSLSRAIVALCEVDRLLADRLCECECAIEGETHTCTALPTMSGPEMMGLTPESESWESRERREELRDAIGKRGLRP